ncbi:helix-turn-helix domain-containing protein [Microbispora sp. NEAU-D428]|uniref:helix-turn-helix domain-containing protein n=1 Tax=Microbispora sitophila TaxID=2771537 RepID=UPI001868CBF3|nr:helix-turn-helix domain-containing protein [Microbispora sitophila]MBE3013270.1 helix-turn-helix domain-containing protein [Microbispora sitophila]
MGRPERDLSPEEGPLQAFAVALRRLREEAGSPTYRALSERAHYSPTVLSRAAGGRVFPSLEVTLAFVRACGGDEDAWGRRWHRVSEEISGRAAEPPEPAPTGEGLSSPVPGAAEAGGGHDADSGGDPDVDPGGDPGAGPDAGPDAGPGGGPDAGSGAGRGGLAGRVRRRGRLLALAAVLVVVGAVALGAAARGVGLAPGWTSRNQHVTDRAGDASRAEDMDGDDPRARGCGDDLQTIDTLDAVPLNLPDGSRFGTLRLRRSPECDTAWASAHFDNPHLYTVWLAAHRPADNAQVRSQWSNNTPPGSYGDMLSLTPGCVWVEGWVVTGQGEGPHARTRCLR